MITLIQCKRALRLPLSGTYMDVGYAAFGRGGRAMVQALVSFLQFGVCCVFIQLIATNLAATLSGGRGLSSTFYTLLVTGVCLCISLLRYIKQLWWLTGLANVLMITALVSSTVEAFVQIGRHGGGSGGSGAAADVFFFLSSMFYAYEGIAIVMPVENGFMRFEDPNTENERHRSFLRLLMCAMSTISMIMLTLGATCGAAFPGISTGSITAYLADTNDNPWYKVVNTLTMVAVLMTFPLQLFPAMEVVNDWFGPGCEPRMCREETESQQWLPQVDSFEAGEGADIGLEELDDGADVPPPHAGCRIEWALRRLAAVIICGAVALAVNNVALLVSLVGSIGSPGLVMMPSFISLSLHYKAIRVLPPWMIAADVLVVLMSLTVAVAGAYFSISELVSDLS
eukprot:CAMPEP_0170191292 /NCGR_PEP_ID=MMETSP0040_2-20121228/51381_1 /TAXON_ID=641309 /ORGANISM="Lotharella oceanica, Strain CCMP622" /LENGTH=397 /DNA_ID=CAMNT_0010439347 /DNA_START=16 /DNA_END=1209 /DNA_ORIENTATION=-